MKGLIVSRHPAAIEFIRRADARFAAAPVVAQATAEVIRDAELVAGNLPVHLAAKAVEYVSVILPDLPREMRGQELSAEDMERLGARLFCCRVVDQEIPFPTEDDWDSSGRRATTPAAAQTARQIALSQPETCPRWDGGALIRWETCGVHLEIEIGPDGSPASFLCVKEQGT